jgi:small subunit ribosomal protein S2
MSSARWYPNASSILFVGTKKQAKTVIKECAEECGEFYVSERWLGGMLTNLSTIRQSVKTSSASRKELQAAVKDLQKKKSILLMGKDQIKLNKNLSGIRAMRKPPGLLIVVDPGREHIAVCRS